MEIKDSKSDSLFKSFWMAGFESGCQINIHSNRIDMLAATQHDVQAANDYQLVKDIGILTVRDGINWPCTEYSPGKYDFTQLATMLAAAEKNNMQVIWNLCHYGWPDDIGILSPQFLERFANYVTATVRFIKDNSSAIPFYVPVNEISFLSWAMGDAQCIHPLPQLKGKSSELKQQLVKAAISACKIIKDIDPRARICHIDPMIHVIPPLSQPQLKEKADIQHNSQFEAWDMIAGKMCPELGGSNQCLDIMGVNFYHANEWEYPDQRLRWEDEPRDERWQPLHLLIKNIYERYHRPLFLAETSHFGAGKGKWIIEIAQEIKKALDLGIPVQGICIYPIIDRPDWDNLNHWHHSGLWELKNRNRILTRELDQGYLQDIHTAQSIVSNY